MTDAQRLDDLEGKLVLAEDLLESLNMTVFRQQEQIQAMQRQLADMARQIAGLSGSAGLSAPADEVPPHY